MGRGAGGGWEGGQLQPTPALSESGNLAPSCFLLRERSFLDSGRAGFLISYRSSFECRLFEGVLSGTIHLTLQSSAILLPGTLRTAVFSARATWCTFISSRAHACFGVLGIWRVPSASEALRYLSKE